jgi:hypothetical protein
LRGVAGPFEVEDLLLALWVLVAERIFLAVLGLGWRTSMGVEAAVFRRPGFVPVGASGEPQTWMVVLPGPLTTLGWLIVAGLLFVIVTRGPDDWSLDEWLKRRFLVMPPPLFYLLHIWAGIAWLVSQLRRKSKGDAAAGERRATPASKPLPTEPQYHGPLVPRVARRLAVVPAALLGESAFRAQVLRLGSDFGSTLTLGTLTLASLRAADGGDLFKLLLSVFLLAGAFAFLVAGPRIAAGATFAWQVWGVRFGLFVASVVMGSRLPAP